MLQFETKVADFIESQALFDPVDKVLLAVSGGADSTALMYAMSALKAAGVLAAELWCCHMNHQLRGAEADLDEEFVVAKAGELKLPAMVKRLNVRGYAREHRLSIETTGRKLRIDALFESARANGCSCIATGHQKDDNAETVVQRLLRGTGFRGLGGIWPVRTFAGGIQFVRPLLCVTRDEIIEYLEGRHLQWRVDHTNFDCTYRRNFIRHRLLPALQEDCHIPIAEQLSELAHVARKFYRLVSDRVDAVWAALADCSGDTAVLDLKKFSAQHPVVKVELVRRGLVAIGSGERDVTQRHYERILQLAEENMSGRQITLPDGFAAHREYGKLILGRSAKRAKTFGERAKSSQVQVPGQTRFGAYVVETTIFEAEGGGFERFKAAKNNFAEWFDLEKLNLPLTVRSRAAGDRFRPLGLADQKKVGKFLTSAKVPLELRQKVLVIADTEKIIWVWPSRMSEQAKVDSGTRKILQLKITDKDEP
ncbi:MAG: tRNA lysidine(34) synthetase TilS [Planctomycetota bacterium]